MVPGLALRRVAIAVRNIEAARDLYESLFGAGFAPVDTVDPAEVRCVVWSRAPGETEIELVQPMNPDNVVARFIRKRGEGVHHLTFEVADLEAAAARVESAGGRVLHVSSYYHSADGSAPREVFLHPKGASGVLVHLVEAG